MREFEVALKVPGELDPALGPVAADAAPAQRKQDEARYDADRPEILGRKARELLALGRKEDARAAAQEALALDPKAEEAGRVLGEVGP